MTDPVPPVDPSAAPDTAAETPSAKDRMARLKALREKHGEPHKVDPDEDFGEGWRNR